MAPRASAVLLVLLLCAFPAVSAATPLAATAGAPAAQSAATQELESENTTFRVQLRPNGNARWTVTETFNLSDANDTRAFEQLGESFVAGDGDAGPLSEFRAASDAASTATGREMAITDASRDYVVDDGQGRLVLSFNWTNFAAVRGGRLLLRDAFYTPDGTWFTNLEAGQSLVISPPRGYVLTNSPQNSYIDEGDLRIDGSPTTTFERGDLNIVYESDNATSTGTGPIRGGDFPLWLGMSLLLVVALVAALLYLNGEDGFPAVGATDTDDGGGDAPAPEIATDDAEPSTDDIDVELLSDEERVERLLTQNGGRMKQARIVKETGWSNAKVSQLLSAMDEDDRIDKLRIGRENLISFPDEDVTEIED
ncbi:helix-turn-helix transcriptional regulator [Haloarcula onubensis]|uniref:HTH iclR-type domain-containing protein n=1 Tax=Haloarcula onubensis TaxID=2950539 RepID=A0ABU2FN31_9EURY|nr:hypothetical protein [Halomicroarcula sp. S3CR25-11]MDS0282166.1 hypothetical protein [Halomicroarcula sp. S3CR25-11]